MMETRPLVGGMTFYIKVKNIETFRKELHSDIEVIKDLNETFYGATEFTIMDLNGYVLTFAGS